MDNRKPIGRAQRFRILSRDGFKCRYCGRGADASVLEIDHIFPVAKGGTNDDENLLAACLDCNHGKGAKIIAASSPHVAADDARLASIKAQREAASVAAKIKSENEELRQDVVNYWCEKMHCESVRRDTLNVLASFVKTHGAALVFQWIEIAASRMRGNSESRQCRYVCGIRKRYLEDAPCQPG